MKRNLAILLVTAFLCSVFMSGCGTTTSSGDTTSAESPLVDENTTGNNTALSEEDAKNIALKDAGLNEADVQRLNIHKDYDDGHLEYEVEFYVGQKEYEYEIDAADGGIINKDIDND